MDAELRERAEKAMGQLAVIHAAGSTPGAADRYATLATTLDHNGLWRLIRDLLDAWEAEYHRPAPRPDHRVNVLRPCADVERPYPTAQVDDLVRAVEGYRTPDFVVEAIGEDCWDRRDAWAASFAHVRVALSRLPEPKEIPF